VTQVTKNNRQKGNRGNSQREPKEYEEELLHLARVTRVVRGGRRLRFRATVAIGNKKGKVGLGTGKSAEVAVAVQKAVACAKKNIVKVPLTENASVPHEVRLKYKAARLLIMPASEGTGVKAGGVVRKIFELAGIHNILAKRFGSTTALVNAQATMRALVELKTN
jgi:small subunit ribosomal protein S5